MALLDFIRSPAHRSMHAAPHDGTWIMAYPRGSEIADDAVKVRFNPDRNSWFDEAGREEAKLVAWQPLT